jgi:hypothetical protein
MNLQPKGEDLLKYALQGAALGICSEEDRTGKRLDIPVPPKYTSADILKDSY